MKRRLIVIAAIVLIVVGLGAYWLGRGGTTVVELQGRALSEVVDLDCFGPLRPHMPFPQVERLVKQARKVHVTHFEYAADGELEHWDVRRTYPGGSGVLSRCPDVPAGPTTPLQFVPDSMTVSDFFKDPMPVEPGTRFIDIRSSGRSVMRICLQDGDAVENIRWYLTE